MKLTSEICKTRSFAFVIIYAINVDHLTTFTNLWMNSFLELTRVCQRAVSKYPLIKILLVTRALRWTDYSNAVNRNWFIQLGGRSEKISYDKFEGFSAIKLFISKTFSLIENLFNLNYEARCNLFYITFKLRIFWGKKNSLKRMS